MTKKEMIKVIQQKEAELWLQVKVDEKLFGTNHIITSKSRGEWSKIHNLMEELEIEPNNLLPENQKATEMIIERMKEEGMA
jgi:nitrogenase molybdenum-iron protein alpha/beta subunit